MSRGIENGYSRQPAEPAIIRLGVDATACAPGLRTPQCRLRKPSGEPAGDPERRRVGAGEIQEHDLRLERREGLAGLAHIDGAARDGEARVRGKRRRQAIPVEPNAGDHEHPGHATTPRVAERG